MVAWRYEISLLEEKFRIYAWPCNILYIFYFNHRGTTQSVCVTVCNFIVNVWDYGDESLDISINQCSINVKLPYLWCVVVLLP